MRQEQKEQVENMIKVLQHYAGGGEIESKDKSNNYFKLEHGPLWDWGETDYRIKQPVKNTCFGLTPLELLGKTIKSIAIDNYAVITEILHADSDEPQFKVLGFYLTCEQIEKKYEWVD